MKQLSLHEGENRRQGFNFQLLSEPFAKSIFNFAVVAVLLVIGLAGGFFLIPVALAAGLILTVPATFLVGAIFAAVRSVARFRRLTVQGPQVAATAVATGKAVAPNSSAKVVDITGRLRPTTRFSKAPIAMIVDDDVDSAQALRLAFQGSGIESFIVSNIREAHRILAFQKFDLVVLDWMLGNRISGGQVIERAAQLIDATSDLQKRFHNHHAKIITFSALAKSNLDWPSNQYFDHTDHWQKPMNFSQLHDSASNFLTKIQLEN